MLGKFAHEVAENLTPEDIAHWIAYSTIRDGEAKKARKGKKG